jgi:hypothetical protein
MKRTPAEIALFKAGLDLTVRGVRFKGKVIPVYHLKKEGVTITSLIADSMQEARARALDFIKHHGASHGITLEANR